MKFKTIFQLFNAIVLLALLMFVISSVFLFDGEYAAAYRANIWIAALVFAVLIGILDFYCISNWNLFTLLEKQDWPALLAWLEKRIYRKGELIRPYANLLISTALSLSNHAALRKLENEVRERRPRLMRSLGVSLGIPLLLEDDMEAVSRYFGPLADDERTQRRDWAGWCRAFASGDEGRRELLELLDGNDPSILLLTLEVFDRMNWNLDDSEKRKIEDIREFLKSSLTGEKGERRLLRSREDHLMALILAPRVNKAMDECLNL